ncbi:uncharacterized protein [Solanum tuberosum]|uniref:uncharacterized protein n=1 Tax=Solanum tuberosum TaxID=4113 RepID=UPI00073A453F|nr:PREDICTED: uncharacterized protein LOC107058538 [Solanum tuberosum]
MRLEASIDVSRLLLQYGLPFRGHDESESSINQGFFLGFLRRHGDKHPDVGKVILKNAPQNDTLTCPMIQKDIVNACAKETLKAIIGDLNGDYFGILVDESKGISHKEQMALVLRFVNKNGKVVERFIGLVHVSDTSACSLKKAIYSLLSVHSLSPSKIRGQGYDGASNMKGEINGFKTLIMKYSPSVYYIHCFAHQLQLTLVAIAKKHLDVEYFFDHVSNVLNVVGGYFKRRDLHRDHQAKKLEKLFEFSEVQKGQGLPQERGLQRPELNDRFDVVSSDLLLGMGSLNPVNSFSNFDKGKIMTLAKCYPSEFNDGKIRDLGYQLDTFIIHTRSGNPKFSNLQGIRDLAKALVEANLAETYSLVYLLVKLTLILHVATAIVERAFSSMKHIKNEVQNSIGYLREPLIYIKDIHEMSNKIGEIFQ